MNVKTRGILFAIVGLAAIAAAALGIGYPVVDIAVGMLFLLLAATTLSKATSIARSLRPFVKQTVRVEVWGAPLPVSDDGALVVDTITSLSAGLLIFLRHDGGPRTLLKVAQPQGATVREDGCEIPEARYVSWGGVKLKRDVSAPAVRITIRPSNARTHTPA